MQDFNVANTITLLRIPILIGMFFVSRNHLIYFMFVSAVTDVLDGFIARTFNMTTKTGIWLDPFCDKLTQLTLVFLLFDDLFKVLVYLSYELILIIFGYLIILKKKQYIKSDGIGKGLTVLFYVFIFLEMVFCLDLINVLIVISLSRLLYYSIEFLKSLEVKK